MLLEKVRTWALGSDGMFSTKGEAADGINLKFSSWKLAYENVELVSNIAWAKLKSVDRSIEKIVRVYSQVLPYLFVCFQILL
jgi:hypothetical protein